MRPSLGPRPDSYGLDRLGARCDKPALMGKDDNRRTLKTRRRKSQEKLKARLRRRAEQVRAERAAKKKG